MVTSVRDEKRARSRKCLGSWRSMTAMLDSCAREGLSELRKVLKEEKRL